MPRTAHFCASATKRTQAHNATQLSIQHKFGASAAQDYAAAFVSGPGHVWPDNFNIHVSFANGSQHQKEAVVGVLKELNAMLGLTITPVASHGHVRVDFNDKQTSFTSAIGPEGVDEDPSKFVRITLGWLDEPLKDPNFLDASGSHPAFGVIKHELGHMLGLEHECACRPKQLTTSNKNFSVHTH